MVGFGTKSGKIAARFERQRNASGIINPSIFETFFFKPDISYLWKQFVNVPEIFFQGQMELKVKQLEEAQQNIKFKPEGSPKGSFRSLPTTPCKENADSWTLSHLSQEIEEAKKQLKLKDQQILQLRAQVSLQQQTPPPSPSSDLALEAKLFKSSLQIAERSKTSSISFQENKVNEEKGSTECYKHYIEKVG